MTGANRLLIGVGWAAVVCCVSAKNTQESSAARAVAQNRSFLPRFGNALFLLYPL